MAVSSQWTVTAARQGNMVGLTISQGDLVQGPFHIPQAEALSLAGYINGLFGATSASMAATAPVATGGNRPKKAGSRRSVARR